MFPRWSSWLAVAGAWCVAWSPMVAGAQPADGEYRLVNECSGKVLEVRGSRIEPGVNARLWTWAAELHQKWRLESLDDGRHRLVAMHSGLVLEAALRSLPEIGAVFQQREWGGTPNQRFTIEDAGAPWMRLRAASGDSYLTVRAGSTEDGAVVWQQPASAVPECSQRWRFDRLLDLGTPVDIAPVAGEGQSAPVGERLRVDPAVRVVDSSGRPVPDMPVRFRVLSGGGRVTGALVPTDADGVARVGGSWRLGPIPGIQKLTATTSGLPEVVFTARAEPIIGTGTLERVVGTDQLAGVAGEPLPLAPAVIVRATDTGVPVPGVLVTFQVTAGGGSVDSVTVYSGLDGRASPGRWLLGKQLGMQSMTVTADGYGAMQFSATAQPPGTPLLRREVILRDVFEVWGMDFTPDGTLLFSERGRGLSARLPDGTVRRLFAPPDFVAQSNSGMLGVAVDPRFELNRRVYVYMTSTASGVRDNRVVRLTVNADYTGVTGRRDIITGITYQRGTVESGHHSGGQLAWGSDGYLYVATGDARTGIVPQGPLELGGKVLRVDPQGRPAEGNAAPPGADPRIFMTGIRNGHGLAEHPFGRGMYLIEHGTGRDDEITRLDVAGRNGGWDPRPRPIGSANAACPNGTRIEYCGYENTKMTNYNWYPDAAVPMWSSGVPAKGTAGGTFVRGSRWLAWQGALAVAQLSGRRLVMMELAEDGNSVVRATPLLEHLGQRIRAVAQGPDRALYVATSSDGNKNTVATEVWRLSPR